MNELRSSLEDVISAGFNDKALAKIKTQIKDVFVNAESDFEDSIKSSISYNLARFVMVMAESSVNAILNGDEDEMRRCLSCVEGRYNGRDKDHPVINGKLFETGAIELRKAIVNAHPELLKNERILDLEDQQASLVKTVNRLESKLREARAMDYANGSTL